MHNFGAPSDWCTRQEEGHTEKWRQQTGPMQKFHARVARFVEMCHAMAERTLHRRSASSAVADQPRRRQISNTARAMRGALVDTYIMSAVSEKLSTRALDTNACGTQCCNFQ